MFGLFKKSESPALEISVMETPKERSMNEIIQEIHDTFYTEVDRLKAEAEIANSLHTDMQVQIDKRNRLVNLGFTSTIEVQEANKEIKRLENLELENKSKERLISAINYFSFNYPHMKFITEESVKKICEKYNLIYGEVSYYKGTVPDKNLSEMENNGAKAQDCCYIKREISMWHGLMRFNYTDHDSFVKFNAPKTIHDHLVIGTYYDEVIKAPLEIAAPAKDFDLDKMEIKDFKINPKIEILDPVVLEPVFYEGWKYYLIRTAWGLEGSGPLVVNHKMN